MYLVLGDWSDDGHGKTDKILVESNMSVKDIKQAYKNSCKLTKIKFEDEVAADFEEPYFSKKAMKIFITRFGLTRDIVKKWNKIEKIDVSQNEFNDFNSPTLDIESFINAWIWFVRLSNPDIQINVIDDEIPCINGYWDKVLNANFGYGLYN